MMHIYLYTYTCANYKNCVHVLETQTVDLSARPGRTSLASFSHPRYNNEICSHICVTGTAYESAVPAKHTVLCVLRSQHSPQAITPKPLITD